MGECKYHGQLPPANKQNSSGFNVSGALCDVLTLIEDNNPKLMSKVDEATKLWWKSHETREIEKTKKEALAKLTPKERRALGLK